jgi:hypothetical protein
MPDHTEESRRFTDREVGLVLKRAAELEERGDMPGVDGRGMSLQQLEEIGAEVGIAAASIREAAKQLALHRGSSDLAILGASPIHKALRAVPRVVDESEVADLIQVVDARFPAQGTVTEALGTVRWTSRLRHGSRQVAITPADGETRIQVSSRYADRLRYIFNFLPGAWGGMIGFAVAVSAGLGALPVAAVIGGSAVVGMGIGRALWNAMAGRTAAEVRDIADELAERAGRTDGH